MHCVASISAQNNKVYPQIGLKHTLSNLDFRAQPRPYDKKIYILTLAWWFPLKRNQCLTGWVLCLLGYNAIQ